MFAVHQRVAHATVFGDADALSTARRRRGTSMGGVVIRGVRPEHALVGPFGHMRIVANAVGPEPPLVADAFIAVAVSVREALGVALLPLRTVGHDEPECTVAPAFSVASTVAQVYMHTHGSGSQRVCDPIRSLIGHAPKYPCTPHPLSFSMRLTNVTRRGPFTTIAVVGTTVGCTVDARVSTEALAGQMRGVGRL